MQYTKKNQEQKQKQKKPNSEFSQQMLLLPSV